MFSRLITTAPIVSDLITFIGNHEELFNSVVAYIRELFAETGDSMLCSLRCVRLSFERLTFCLSVVTAQV